MEREEPRVSETVKEETGAMGERSRGKEGRKERKVTPVL